MANNYATEELQNDEQQARQTKKFKKGRKALRNKNPELFKQLKNKRKEWKGLSVEEREQARSEWFKQNPRHNRLKRPIKLIESGETEWANLNKIIPSCMKNLSLKKVNGKNLINKNVKLQNKLL